MSRILTRLARAARVREKDGPDVEVVGGGRGEAAAARICERVYFSRR